MSGQLSPIDKAKFVAAKRAADFVEDDWLAAIIPQAASDCHKD